MYDVVVVGCGPAGMTAAIYAARAGKSVKVLEKQSIGGQIATSPFVENFTAHHSSSGIDLADDMYNQMMQLGVDQDFSEVCNLSRNKKNIFVVHTESDVICAKSIIIASGSKHRQLGVPGETEYAYYCATCDGPLFKDKRVVVVGAGNTGAQYALELASYCSSVVLCDVVSSLRCEDVLARRIAATPNISLKLGVWVDKFCGDEGGLRSILFYDGSTVEADGVFVAVGQTPDTDFVRNFVVTDASGYICTDEDMNTSVPGVFAAGDCRKKTVRQAIVAAGEGAVAAISALKYLHNTTIKE